jgi:aminoglycoside 3-N-acetyltransferase
VAAADDRSVLTHWKQRVKPLYLRGRRLVARRLFAYSEAQLEAAIASLGVQPGDAVMVHSGFAPTSGFAGTPGDVIEVLLRAVGPAGHLLMLSIPYRGSSQGYAESDPLFDVRRTPSKVGVVSELFRRRPGVLRSLSPLHPVAVHGPLAAWLVADHDAALRSCGKGTPFERFLSLNGKLLFFDAPYQSMTFMHYIEDACRDRLPVELYDPTPRAIRVRDDAGREREVQHLVFSAAARARRHVAPVEAALRRDGALRLRRVGNSRLQCVAARDVLRCSCRLLDEGSGFYA